MAKLIFILLIFNLFLPAQEKQPNTDPESKKAFNDLGQYYQDKNKIPPYLKAMEDLNSQDASLSENAGKYYYALLSQMFKDESNGRAKWESQPYWGGGSKSVARDFRKTVAEYFGKKASSKSALIAVNWLLNHEKSPVNQEQAIKVLIRVKAKESTNQIKRIVIDGHPNFKVYNEAIIELTKRKPEDLKDLLLKAAKHYRDDIRKNARKGLETLGIKLKPFSIEDGFTPSLIKNINLLSEVMLPIRPESTFGKFVYKTGVSYGDENGKMVDEEATVYGWKFKEDNSVKILDWYGTYQTPDSIVKEENLSLSKAVDQLLSDRLLENPQESLSRRGGLTGQFQPRFLSEPEIRVSVWCWRKQLKKETGRLLFPRMNNMGDERWLIWVARDLFGHPKHQAMLEHFTHERDYEKALAIATILAKPFFEEYQYHKRAVELKKQLLARKDIDFKTLTLPDKDQWKKLKEIMSREAQIRFLANKLRLLNCFQMGQPGGVNYTDPQSADIGVSPVYEERNIVINPYNELMELKLSVVEIPYLTPYLNDENFMLTFSYWRDFHPSRTFHRVNWAIAKIIDDTAKKELSNLSKYYQLKEEGRKKHIQDILEWCETNKNLSRKDLVLKTLKETKNWHEFSKNTREAIAGKYSDTLLILIDAYSRFAKNQDDVMEYICKLNNKNALNFAIAKIDSKNEGVKFWSAILTISHAKEGNFKKGLTTLKNILSEDDGSYWYPRAAIPLLKAHSEEAKKLACGILKKKSLDMDFGGPIIVHNLLLEKREEALNFLLEGLKSEENGRYQNSIKGDKFVEVISELTKHKFKFDEKWATEKKVKTHSEISKWLIEEFNKLKEGKEHQFIKTPRTLYHAKWMLDAP